MSTNGFPSISDIEDLVRWERLRELSALKHENRLLRAQLLLQGGREALNKVLGKQVPLVKWASKTELVRSVVNGHPMTAAEVGTAVRKVEPDLNLNNRIVNALLTQMANHKQIVKIGDCEHRPVRFTKNPGTLP